MLSTGPNFKGPNFRAFARGGGGWVGFWFFAIAKLGCHSPNPYFVVGLIRSFGVSVQEQPELDEPSNLVPTKSTALLHES